LNTANARIAAVIVTPIDQPVLKKTYRFDTHINPPISIPTMIARSVSCGSFGRCVSASQRASVSCCGPAFVSAKFDFLARSGEARRIGARPPRARQFLGLREVLWSITSRARCWPPKFGPVARSVCDLRIPSGVVGSTANPGSSREPGWTED